MLSSCQYPESRSLERPQGERTDTTTEISDQELSDYRDQAEASRDEPLSGAATRPGWQRGKVLSVRLSAEEFDELTRYATALEVPASGLVRGWILEQLRAGTDSPVSTVERISHEPEHLRRQPVA